MALYDKIKKEKQKKEAKDLSYVGADITGFDPIPDKAPTMPGVLGTNQTSNQGSLPGKFLQNIKNLFSPKAPEQPFWNPETKARYEPLLSDYGSIMSDLEAETGDASGIGIFPDTDKIGLTPDQMSQLKVMGGKGAPVTTIGAPTTKDTQKLEDVGFEISEADSDKQIKKILGVDPKTYKPSFPELSGVPAPEFTSPEPPEDLQNESGGAQWGNAFKELQKQLFDSEITLINLPVVYNEDGSVVDFYIDQPTTQVVTDTSGNVTTQETTQRVLNPKYQALQDYARNAQNQKNFQAQQKQQMEIQQLSMFPQILHCLLYTSPSPRD